MTECIVRHATARGEFSRRFYWRLPWASNDAHGACVHTYFALPNAVTAMVERSGLPERTLKRRFKVATGYAPVEYVQALRIEEAKQMLETEDSAIEEIGAEVGYSDPTFFRKLFRRRVGVTPAQYRQRKRFRGLAQ